MAFLFGLQPEPAMVLVPVIGVLTGIGFAALGMWFAAMVSTYDGFSYVISGVITPLFLVAGTFFPVEPHAAVVQSLAELNPLYHCVELCGTARSDSIRLRIWSTWARCARLRYWRGGSRCGARARS